MDMRQLRYFVGIAESGSLSAASIRLGVAQPSLSQHVLQIEKSLGVELLVRTARGVTMTENGKILPQLLQEEFGYTATLAGLAISPGGAVTMCMMVAVGRLGFVQPRYLIAAGAAISCYAMVDLLRINPDADYWYFAWSRVYLGIGLPLIFIPITAASYDGIPPDKTDQASALINLARNLGGSMGVALSQTVLARREQFHQSHLVEHLGSWNPFYNDTLSRIQGISERPRGHRQLFGNQHGDRQSNGANPSHTPGLYRRVCCAGRDRHGDGAAGPDVTHGQPERWCEIRALAFCKVAPTIVSMKPFADARSKSDLWG